MSRHALTLLCFALTVLLSGAAIAQSDFTGTWELDRRRSDSMDPMLERCGVGAAERAVATAFEPTVTIQQDGRRVMIHQETFTSSIDNEMILDGKRRSTTTPLGSMNVRATAKKNGTIETETTTQCKRNGVAMTMTTKRYLKSNREMVLELNVDVGNGKRVAIRRVFTRK